MKALFAKPAVKTGFLLFLMAVASLASGCTSALWQDETFAHKYTPAVPSDIHLYYSGQRKDVLVQYSEIDQANAKIRTRYYWIEPNESRITRDERPRFVSSKKSRGLTPIPIIESRTNSAASTFNGLYAFARPDDYLFTLYLANNQMDAHELPRYRGSGDKVKKILLTPFAVTVDLTLFGAVVYVFSEAGAHSPACDSSEQGYQYHR